jgi:hypothetical protein
MKTIALFLFLFSSSAQACDFCMLGQGISPYLTSTGKGLTLDANYTESDKVYNGKTVISDDTMKEGWLIYTLTGFYPVTDKLNAFVSVPYAIKTNLDYDADTNTTPGVLTNGLGDVTVSGRYTFFSNHTLTQTFLVGGLLGVKLPTGSTHEYNSAGGLVDRHALPGTGSVDGVFGVNALYSFGGDWQITGDAVYDLAGDGNWGGNAHRYGNSLNYSVKGFYKILPKDPGEKNLFVFTGVSGHTMGKEIGVLTDDGTYLNGVTNDSSGGTVLWLDFGIHTTLSASTILDLGFSKAFYHDMNYSPNFDPDPAEDYRLDFSLTYLF